MKFKWLGTTIGLLTSIVSAISIIFSLGMLYMANKTNEKAETKLLNYVAEKVSKIDSVQQTQLELQKNMVNAINTVNLQVQNLTRSNASVNTNNKRYQDSVINQIVSLKQVYLSEVEKKKTQFLLSQNPIK
jgi:hypothetical protein